MKDYDVILEITAETDFRGILDYITDILLQPETAKRIYFSIKEQVMKLNIMPARHSVVRDEPYASLGVRWMSVENYVAFYMIDETKSEVHVLRILYQKREWQNLL